MFAKSLTVSSRSSLSSARPPEARRPVRAVGPRREHLLGLLHDLEDHLAKAEECLAWRPGRRGLLADAAQVQSGGLSACTLRLRSAYIATTWSIA